MITKTRCENARAKALSILTNAGIVLTKEEQSRIEVADFGLNDLERYGLQLVTYINTGRVCAKELVLLPWQTCPEHRHPPFKGYPGKEETFRCRTGIIYLVVPGEPTPLTRQPDPSVGAFFTARHEIILRPGDQYTIPLDTPHWFYAGADGAIVSEFSTASYDDRDVFTDSRVIRAPSVK